MSSIDVGSPHSIVWIQAYEILVYLWQCLEDFLGIFVWEPSAPNSNWVLVDILPSLSLYLLEVQFL